MKSAVTSVIQTLQAAASGRRGALRAALLEDGGDCGRQKATCGSSTSKASKSTSQIGPPRRSCSGWAGSDSARASLAQIYREVAAGESGLSSGGLRGVPEHGARSSLDVRCGRRRPVCSTAAAGARRSTSSKVTAGVDVQAETGSCGSCSGSRPGTRPRPCSTTGRRSAIRAGELLYWLKPNGGASARA